MNHSDELANLFKEWTGGLRSINRKELHLKFAQQFLNKKVKVKCPDSHLHGNNKTCVVCDYNGHIEKSRLEILEEGEG